MSDELPEELQPSADNKIFYRGRRDRRVYHTRRCASFKACDKSRMEKLPKHREWEFRECELCQGNIDRSTQKRSLAKAIRNGEVEVDIADESI